MTCTFVHNETGPCTKTENLIPQVGSTGKTWATLCPYHHNQVETALHTGNPKRIVSAWIQAQGGAIATAKRLAEHVD